MQLKIIKNKPEVILLKIEFEDKIDQLSTAGFTGKEKYISITKGQDHTFTVHQDNNQFSISFGLSEYTVIDNNLEIMKTKVLQFLLKQHINIENKNTKIENDLKIMYWPHQQNHSDKYCVHLGDSYASHFNTVDEIINTFGKYKVNNRYTAKTGVNVIDATLI